MEVDAYIFSDEVYFSFRLNCTYCVDLYEKGIAVNSLQRLIPFPVFVVG